VRFPSGLARLKRQRMIAVLESRLSAAEIRHRPGILTQLAELYEAAGRHDDAHTAHVEVLASRDADLAARAAHWLGVQHEASGSFAEAEASYEQALLFRTPEAFQSAMALARLRMARGDLDPARKALRFAATSADPDLAITATVMLAELAEQRGNHWGAQTLRDRAERLESTNVDS
jgi:tetratricopeptide (TPR) repeat protein